MTFEEFKSIIREGEVKGEVKTTVPLTDFDLAVQWAIGRIGDRKGYPCDITIDEIWSEMYYAFYPEDDGERKGGDDE